MVISASSQPETGDKPVGWEHRRLCTRRVDARLIDRDDELSAVVGIQLRDDSVVFGLDAVFIGSLGSAIGPLRRSPSAP
jgi:hypothetical protein